MALVRFAVCWCQRFRACRRAAQVPLVEGVAFALFTMRVRRRLGLPDGARVVLRDAATGVVDSIDRLLEVDEGVTLEVTSDMPSCLSVAAATSAATHRAAAAKAQEGGAVGGAGGAGGAGAGPKRECRMDIPVSEWARSAREREDEEGGDGKYRRRRKGLTAGRVARWVLGLAAVGGALYMLLGSGSAA